MSILGYFILLIYFVAISYVTVYCLMQLHLLFKYNNKNKPSIIEPELSSVEQLPFVTVQLPLYNEYYVVDRLIDNITKLDYPKDRFEIQVIDDSTDESIGRAQEKVKEYKAKGFLIDHITREKRTGYKAGALKDAMPFVKGEFIAIFDADFLPNPDFLRRTIPYFNDPQVGVVQTRWDHINQDYSLLTEVQAFQLNVHFTVEQLGRSKGDYLLQFNGTAGVWRKETIENAGGWEADTLTEDLDLSYRAQLKGWQIVYLEDILSPAELPAEMHGLKSQQFRWMKGGAETAVKMLPTVWKSELKFIQKIHASTHLLGSTVFIFIFLLGVFSVPMYYWINPLNISGGIHNIFMISMISILAVYYTANVKTAWKAKPTVKMVFKFLVLFPVFLALSMGLSFHNTIAVLQGLIGKKSSFVRTPKFNINSIADKVLKKKYTGKKIGMTTYMEGLLSLYFIYAVFLSFYFEHYSMTIFHTLLAIGYGMIFCYSIKHLNYK